LGAHQVANGVREVILEAEDQALALRHLPGLGAFSFESAQLGDLTA
jgi:hypothetical protein